MNNEYVNLRELAGKYEFVMPLIQRDFAFGRKDEKKKRENFIEYILGTVQSTECKPLDFVYGTIDDAGKRFVTLDGQQRVTVLMLFYWLFSARALGWKFSYVMRRIADTFVGELMRYAYGGEGIPSVWIKNQPWFAPFWMADATVRGMLTTLDCIYSLQQKVGVLVETGDEWLDRVVFYVQELSEHHKVRSDNAYVKMNARGLPLTEWEKVKSLIDADLSTLAMDDDKDNDADKHLLMWRTNVDGQWRDCIEEAAIEHVKQHDVTRESPDPLKRAIAVCDHLWLRLLDAAIVLTIRDKSLNEEDECAALIKIGKHAAVYEDYNKILQAKNRADALMLFLRFLHAFAENGSVLNCCWTSDRLENALWDPTETIDHRFQSDSRTDFVDAVLYENDGSGFGYGAMLRLYALTCFIENGVGGKPLSERCFATTRVLNLIDNSDVDSDNVVALAHDVERLSIDITSLNEIKTFGAEQRREELFKITLPWGDFKTFEKTHLLYGAISLFLRGDHVITSRTWHAYLTYLRDFHPLEAGESLGKEDAAYCFEQLMASLMDEDFNSEGDMLDPRRDKERWRKLFRSRIGIRAFSNFIMGSKRHDLKQAYGLLNVYREVSADVDRIGMRGNYVFAMYGTNWAPKSVRLSYTPKEQENLKTLSELILKRDCEEDRYVMMQDKIEGRNLYLKVSELGHLPPIVYEKSDQNEWIIANVISNA